LIVLAMFAVLELFTNLVLETVLYAGAVGVSQVVLLVSVAFWTWLWGPLGLLMAAPLTVCLVVLGKHVPGLEFVGLLMDDTPALADESPQPILDAGANHVASLLVESRNYLGSLLEMPRLPVPDTAGAGGLAPRPPSIGSGPA
jgi:hypothetical protein